LTDENAPKPSRAIIPGTPYLILDLVLSNP
jgi:hypothetical protein